MSNLMSNIYIGLVVEIIKENGKPTLDIRVRIPSLHIGLKDEDLPIAKPIIMPGMFVDPIHFENYFSQVNRVYVIFDSGSKAMPRYFGALGEGASTIDYVPIQNQDTQQTQKMRLYIVNNQIGYDIEE